MNKDRFIFLMNNYTALTDAETMELVQAQKEFPFSQVIHSLAAKGAITNNLAIKDQKLHTAAVYITDRSVLKSIATAPKVDRKPQQGAKPKEKVESPPPIPVPKVEVKKEVAPAQTKPLNVAPKEAEITKSPRPEVNLVGDELIDELYHDLDKLKHLKHDYEAMVAELDNPLSRKKMPTPVAPEPQAEKKVVEKPKKKKAQGDGIIDQIKSTKKKIKPSDPKQKEQLDIINQFIKSKPNFKNQQQAPEVDVPAPDLSESSNVFSDNIVSETLVEILIKQGKKEKAVEVLKKLIWKFPQKKAYFAAQIEELKS